MGSVSVVVHRRVLQEEDLAQKERIFFIGL